MTFLNGFHLIGPREAGLYLWNLVRPVCPDQVRVVIFGQGRTGSTVLESLLCSTGHFEKNGELFNVQHHGQVSYPVHYVQGLAKWRSKVNFIFHVKIYQLTRDRRKPLDPRLFLRTLSNNNWKIIYIRRENIIRQVLSGLVALQRSAYHKLDDRPEKLKLVIDCDDFVERVFGRLRFEEQEALALEGIEYASVVYESDLERDSAHQRTIDRILGFLSLEKRPAFTAYRKIIKLPMSELIANYGEFVACMKQHGWEALLDSPFPQPKVQQAE